MRFRLAKPSFAPRLTLAALVLGLSLSTGAQAAPAADDLDNWLADKGMLSQIQQVRHNVSLKASELVVHAIGFLGVPYQRGGNTVETGFDCSGFVKAIYEQTIGLVLPRRAEQQAAATQNIERKDLAPGDLVFFNTMRRAFSHVGIYIGDGKFIHSPKPGAEVRVESLAAAYWNRRFDGARRVDTTQDDAGPSVATALRSQAKPDSLAGAQPKR
jgi:cell wall-associated NlpC family hydrolase